jgi:hypothetical protein
MLVVVLLLLVAAGGAYNYHRNLLAEQAEQGSRPFKGYADQDLRDLESAYSAQVESRRDSYESLASRRVKTRKGEQTLGDHVAHFERIQRVSEQKRDAAGDLAVNQARLREIEAELAYRDYVKGGPMVHIKRLTTL